MNEEKANVAVKTDTKKEMTAKPEKMLPEEMMTFRRPFTLMRHFAEDMENMMADFGFDRTFPRFNWLETEPFFADREMMMTTFAPAVEMIEKDGYLLVKADLPGIEKDNIKVEIRDNRLIIEGERKEEFKDEREGFYITERSYGKFLSQLTLPEKVKTEDAKAVFKNGVLEIKLAAPELKPETTRLEIEDFAAEPKVKATAGQAFSNRKTPNGN